MNPQQCNPLECPNRLEIQGHTKDIESLWTAFHELDKQTAVDQATINTQYETIIKLLTDNATHSAELTKRITELEKNQVLTGYQANKTTDFLEKLTWATVSKIAAIAIVVGGVLMNLKK